MDKLPGYGFEKVYMWHGQTHHAEYMLIGERIGMNFVSFNIFKFWKKSPKTKIYILPGFMRATIYISNQGF